MTKNDGSKKIFKQSKKGLYYMDTDENVMKVVLLSTIEKKSLNTPVKTIHKQIWQESYRC